MIIKILNNTTPYGKIMASDEGSLHSSTFRTFGLLTYTRSEDLGTIRFAIITLVLLTPANLGFQKTDSRVFHFR